MGAVQSAGCVPTARSVMTGYASRPALRTVPARSAGMMGVAVTADSVDPMKCARKVFVWPPIVTTPARVSSVATMDAAASAVCVLQGGPVTRASV